jgi:hypothetical protein
VHIHRGGLAYEYSIGLGRAPQRVLQSHETLYMPGNANEMGSAEMLVLVCTESISRTARSRSLENCQVPPVPLSQRPQSIYYTIYGRER